ncbi:TRAP transporter substrate-binding protein [Luteithermobacter gelatinilyticus]|uniref:TRAP transporter substrate-binding protein n=1 Tax=Luteithermobacter gelatinilyticus TaxID=2582913 RepID=UPI0011070623|nr:TRAP transporter substrate-binding protein [Luteithermobacter gelatinilyticus]
MKRRSFLKSAALGGAGSLATASLATPAYARSKRKLKMVTTWPKNFPGLGTRAEQIAKDIKAATEGEIDIKVYAAGELVPALGAFDAVSGGKADIYHGVDYYWQGKHKAFAFFGAVPFGLTAREMVQWIDYGGGQALWDELAGQFQIKSLLCGNTSMQMGGWFKKEINSLEDFKGLRMRIPGMGGEILKRLGATPVTKAGGEIFLALSQGNIDASEWIGPWNDLAFGFYKIAPYYYTSVFHEPSASVALGFNKDVWSSFSKAQKTTIRAIAAYHYQQSIAEFNAQNATALRTLEEKHGVKVRRFSDEIMQALADTAAEVVREVGMSDDLSRRIYNSYMETRRSAMQWSGIADEPYLANRRLPKNFGEKI